MYSNEIFFEERNVNEIAFNFNVNECYSRNGYNALVSMIPMGFVPCNQLVVNGKVKIVYDTSAYTSLYDMISYLTPEMFERISANLLSKLDIFRSNPVLRCENVFLSTDKIFIDRNTLDVYLIYLPLESGDNADYMPRVESKLREKLAALVENHPNLRKPAEPVYAPPAPPVYTPPVAPRAEPVYTPPVVQPAQPAVPPMTPVATVPTVRVASKSYVLRSHCASADLRITSDEFVIGKSQSRVDGVVTGSNLVSRVHCKAIVKDDSCYIMDLNSLNGTCLNGRRINPGEMYKLTEGTRVSIADMDFIFAIE